MEALDAVIEAERRRFRVEGLAVAVVQGGETLLARGFGVRERDSALPVTDQTLFAIGSSTKAFTASLVAALVDDGLVEWDTPIREYLPEFRMHDPVATEHATLRDLLSHRCGLPRHDLVWYSNSSVTRAEMVRRLRYLEPNKTFREMWQYNNLMYLTAGYLAGEVLGCSWEEAVRQRLLAPLRMTNTNFSTIESQKSDDYAVPYTERDDKVLPVEFRELPLGAPAGSINSCVADMAGWVAAQLNDGRLGDRQVISTSALRELQAPTMVMPEGPQLWSETYLTGYALGWMLESYRGHKLVHHGGNVDGFSTLVAFAPKADIGVVALSNMNGTPVPNVVVYRVLDELLGLDPLPWGQRYRELLETARAGAKQAAAHQAAKSLNQAPTHPIADYAGEYHHPGYGAFVVTVEGDNLMPHYNDMQLLCDHRHLDTWDLTLEIFELHLPLTFSTDADGNVASLAIPMEPTVDPIVFVRKPDTATKDPELLARLTGTYEMGPLRLVITVRGGTTMTASVAGQGDVELEPHHGTLFRVKGQPAMTMEFLLDDQLKVTEVVVQPAGIFHPVAEG